MKAAPLQQRRLSDDIIARIETLILEGSFRAGERLPAERALAEEFGVSRPSLREAIQKLVARGLLISRHGGGTFVSESLGSSFRDPMIELLEHNPEAQRDLIEFRHTLEGSCAYYAAQRATEPDRQRLSEAFAALQDCYERGGKVTRAEEGAADARVHLAIAEASHNAVLLHTMPEPDLYGRVLHRLQEGLQMGWKAGNLLAQRGELGWERPLAEWREKLAIEPARP